jgi:transposase
MEANMGRRYRLYPTMGQAERLTGWGHTCRAVWNVALAQRQFLYAQRGISLRAAEQHRQLTEARAELDWLANLPAQSGQQVLAHLDRAYDNWWNLKHPAGPPRFKKRRDEVSVPFPGQAVAVRKLNNRWARCGCRSSAGCSSAYRVPWVVWCETPPCRVTLSAGTSPLALRPAPSR